MRHTLKTVLLLFFISISITVFADPGGGTGGDPDGTPADTDIPIDGGLSLLLAAGAGYGLRKIAQKRK